MYSTWLLLIITSVTTIKRQQQTTWHTLVFDTSIFIPFVLPLILSSICLWHIVPHLSPIIISFSFFFFIFPFAFCASWVSGSRQKPVNVCFFSSKEPHVGSSLRWEGTVNILSLKWVALQEICTFSVPCKSVLYNTEAVCWNVTGSRDPNWGGKKHTFHKGFKDILIVKQLTPPVRFYFIFYIHPSFSFYTCFNLTSNSIICKLVMQNFHKHNTYIVGFVLFQIKSYFQPSFAFYKIHIYYLLNEIHIIIFHCRVLD